MTRHVGIEEAAAAAGVTPRTIRGWMEAGDLRWTGKKSAPRFSLRDVYRAVDLRRARRTAVMKALIARAEERHVGR